MSVPFSIDELHHRLASRTPVGLSAALRASVAIILGQAGPESASELGNSSGSKAEADIRVLFIRRAEHPLDPWSGHMALPGGRRDPLDADDFATAQRETLEEVGLDLSTGATALGRLDDIKATARGRVLDMVISPFVFSVESLTPIVPTREVVAGYWAPILPLYRGDAATVHQVDFPEGRFDLPAWNVQGNLVWGLTYRMMVSLFAVMQPPSVSPCQ